MGLVFCWDGLGELGDACGGIRAVGQGFQFTGLVFLAERGAQAVRAGGWSSTPTATHSMKLGNASLTENQRTVKRCSAVHFSAHSPIRLPLP